MAIGVPRSQRITLRFRGGVALIFRRNAIIKIGPGSSMRVSWFDHAVRSTVNNIIRSLEIMWQNYRVHSFRVVGEAVLVDVVVRPETDEPIPGPTEEQVRLLRVFVQEAAVTDVDKVESPDPPSDSQGQEDESDAEDPRVELDMPMSFTPQYHVGHSANQNSTLDVDEEKTFFTYKRKVRATGDAAIKLAEDLNRKPEGPSLFRLLQQGWNITIDAVKRFNAIYSAFSSARAFITSLTNGSLLITLISPTRTASEATQKALEDGSILKEVNKALAAIQEKGQETPIQFDAFEVLSCEEVPMTATQLEELQVTSFLNKTCLQRFISRNEHDQTKPSDKLDLLMRCAGDPMNCRELSDQVFTSQQATWKDIQRYHRSITTHLGDFFRIHITCSLYMTSDRIGYLVINGYEKSLINKVDETMINIKEIISELSGTSELHSRVMESPDHVLVKAEPIPESEEKPKKEELSAAEEQQRKRTHEREDHEPRGKCRKTMAIVEGRPVTSVAEEQPSTSKQIDSNKPSLDVVFKTGGKHDYRNLKQRNLLSPEMRDAYHHVQFYVTTVIKGCTAESNDALEYLQKLIQSGKINTDAQDLEKYGRNLCGNAKKLKKGKKEFKAKEQKSEAVEMKMTAEKAKFNREKKSPETKEEESKAKETDTDVQRALTESILFYQIAAKLHSDKAENCELAIESICSCFRGAAEAVNQMRKPAECGRLIPAMKCIACILAELELNPRRKQAYIETTRKLACCYHDIATWMMEDKKYKDSADVFETAIQKLEPIAEKLNKEDYKIYGCCLQKYANVLAELREIDKLQREEPHVKAQNVFQKVLKKFGKNKEIEELLEKSNVDVTRITNKITRPSRKSSKRSK